MFFDSSLSSTKGPVISVSDGILFSGTISLAPPLSSRRDMDGYSNHHADFIKRFAQQESQNRVKKKNASLNAKQRAALREQLKEVHFLKPDYADNTKINMKMYKASPLPFFSLSSFIFFNYNYFANLPGYCKATELGHWKQVIEKADRAIAIKSMCYYKHRCALLKTCPSYQLALPTLGSLMLLVIIAASQLSQEHCHT